jgi:hypothetical protein
MYVISFYRNTPGFWNFPTDGSRAWTYRAFVWCVYGVAVHWRGFWRWHFKSFWPSACFIVYLVVRYLLLRESSRNLNDVQDILFLTCCSLLIEFSLHNTYYIVAFQERLCAHLMVSCMEKVLLYIMTRRGKMACSLGCLSKELLSNWSDIIIFSLFFAGLVWLVTCNY